jgi:hypothetical protein
LPADLRKRHHLDDPEAHVRGVERDDGVIELHPLASVPADQRWFWSERWQRMKREVDSKNLNDRETRLSREAVRKLNRACDRALLEGDRPRWPKALRVKDVEGAPGICRNLGDDLELLGP